MNKNLEIEKLIYMKKINVVLFCKNVYNFNVKF